MDALKIVMDAGPDFLNHNIETVPRLFPSARKGGDYEVSLRLLKDVRTRWPGVPSKSGMMLGLGEEDHEIERVLGDLRRVGVRILTLGQYLKPDARSLEVAKFYTPEEFAAWGERARSMGFDHVESAPLVRSSYHAERQAADV